MDILEHVEDDVTFIQEYSRNVLPGTNFLISVPAFQFLWSDHDVFVEHKRRYQLTEIEAVCQRAGLAVFPLAVITRLLSKIATRLTKKPPTSSLTLHHPFVNKTLQFMCDLDFLFFMRNRLMGLTAFCLCKKV